MKPVVRKIIVIGLDGFEPKIVDAMLSEGALPHLQRLAARGGYTRVATTSPAQTPVAWSTFATGVNPGGHGVFDFIARDPATYLPQLALNRYEQKNAFMPPRVVNRRRGEAIWDVLTRHSVPSVVLRCPCTYPAEPICGRMLAGMGVPDLRGSLGVGTFYTTRRDVAAGESESVVHVERNGAATLHTHLLGPLAPRTHAPAQLPLHVDINGAGVRIHADGAGEVALTEGQWSPWLKVRFRTGVLQSARGMVRFHLRQALPELELYASPVNFDPEGPLFPVSHPHDYARELEQALGGLYTTGMVEDHSGLENGRLEEGAFLAQCDDVWRERQGMLLYELQRFREGFLFCLFDTPDRVQHIFWRFRDDPSASADAFRTVVADEYRRADVMLGRVLEHVDDETLLIVLSDHGFAHFRRGVHLNAWLHAQGLLALQPGVRPGHEAGDLFRHVDWSRTHAYSVGLGAIYLNRRGREAQGIVSENDAPRLKQSLRKALTGLADTERGQTAVRGVSLTDEIYSGPCAAEAPDLLVNFADGYRASWETVLGGVPADSFGDNTRRWRGDHIIDPALVPGVLFMNRPFAGRPAHLRDLAPTVLAALGVPRGDRMEGESLLS